MKHAEEKPRENILVVEDEDLLRWSIQRFLQSRSYRVDAVADGRLALEKLAGESYDLIISDLKLHGADGLELAEAARKANPHTQVVIITGNSSKQSILQALRQGVWDYVEKPFELELLLLTVEKALEKSRMEKELIHLSRTDGLTGLYNQRHFYETLEAEMRRAQRQGRPLSLILFDVDEFKQFNDTHGHIEGDYLLVRLASCIAKACRRDVDMAFRYGGDEFVVILPESPEATAERVAGRVCDLLRDEGIETTLSIGVTELRERKDLKAAVKEADDAMYLAKQFVGNLAITFNKSE